MQKSVFSFVLMLTASISFAQANTAYSACQRIAEANSADAGACVKPIFCQTFDQVDTNSPYALEEVEMNASSPCMAVRAVEDILATPIL